MPRGAVAALFFLLLTSALQANELAYQRVIEASRSSPLLPEAVIDRAEADCETALCFAKTLAASLPDKIRLEPVTHPDTDSIRWVETGPSVTISESGGTRHLKIQQFGRKAAAELREASAPGGSPVVIDLRGNAGGDFERMLDIAGLLIGARRDAIEIDHGDRTERRSLTGPKREGLHITRVLTDQKTASAALLLANLLANGGTQVAGPRPDGPPIHLKRRIPIDHDWRLVLPVAEVRIVPE